MSIIYHLTFSTASTTTTIATTTAATTAAIITTMFWGEGGGKRKDNQEGEAAKYKKKGGRGQTTKTLNIKVDDDQRYFRPSIDNSTVAIAVFSDCDLNVNAFIVSMTLLLGAVAVSFALFLFDSCTLTNIHTLSSSS